MTPLEQSLVLGLGVLAAFFASVLLVLCALLYIDKRELVEALEMLVKNPFQNDAGKWVAAQEKAKALIAKHKQENELDKKGEGL